MYVDNSVDQNKADTAPQFLWKPTPFIQLSVCLSVCLFAVNMRALHSFRVNTEIWPLVFVADSRVGTEDKFSQLFSTQWSTRLHLVGANELNEPFNGDIYF